MDTVRIDRFTSRVHAELACSMLVAHGLNARVSGDDVGGVHPDIPYGIGGTAIVVPAEQQEEANALLDEEFAGELGDDSLVASDTASPDERPWAPTGRTAERRPGMRVFAVVAAVSMALVFVAVTGLTAAWWG